MRSSAVAGGSSPTMPVHGARAADWKAPVVEVREVGGVRGLLVEMVRGEGTGAMTSLTLKLPVGEGSADFIGTAPTSEFAAARPLVERILFSIQPRAEATNRRPEGG